MIARHNPTRARLARFLRTSRRLSSSALRAVEAGDDAALQRQAEQHLYVLAEVQRLRAEVHP